MIDPEEITGIGLVMRDMALDVADAMGDMVNAVLPVLAPAVALGIVALAGVKYIRRFAKA